MQLAGNWSFTRNYVVVLWPLSFIYTYKSRLSAIWRFVCVCEREREFFFSWRIKINNMIIPEYITAWAMLDLSNLVKFVVHVTEVCVGAVWFGQPSALVWFGCRVAAIFFPFAMFWRVANLNAFNILLKIGVFPAALTILNKFNIFVFRFVHTYCKVILLFFPLFLYVSINAIKFLSQGATGR